MQLIDAQFVKSLLSDMSLFVNATATCTLFHSISVVCYCVLCVRGVVFLITPCPLSAFDRKRLRGVSDVVLEMKSEEVDKRFMTADVSSLKC